MLMLSLDGIGPVSRIHRGGRILCAALLAGLCIGLSAQAQSAVKWPTADGVYTIPDFHFGSGETLPQLRLHYLTLGKPHRDASGHVDNAVLLLHGTGGAATALLAPQFSNVLFGPGQPLDIERYYLIFPDDIGHGSSRPAVGRTAYAVPEVRLR